MVEITFIYEGINTIIQSNINEKIKDIIDKFMSKIEKTENNLIFLYNGSKIKEDLTFIEQANESDKKRLKMNILVYNIDKIENNEKKEIISKDIICPECKENIFIDIKDFKISFYGCKNNHNINNIILYKYKETQKIDLNKIICDICNKNNKGNTHNNKFYLCNTCDKRICPLCKINHDKDHLVIDYDNRNYICRKHNEPFSKYCQKCNKDICIACSNEHKDHDNIDYCKIFVDKDNLNKINEDLKNSIDKFKYKIEVIKEIFNKMIDILNIYYKINDDMIHDYKTNERNFYKLVSINNIINSNKKMIEYINNMINYMIDNNKISEIYDFSFKNFYNENGDKYIGNMKNNLKEGKGIIFYNKDDKYNRNKYEGLFKNDKKEGNGKLYFNNGDIYDGEFKNDLFEGNGIYYFNSGNKYDGRCKNNLREGKGTFYYKNGDRYEGDWKNDKKEGKGIYYWNNGDRYEGYFKNDVKEGEGIFIYSNGKKEEGIWKNDKIEGKGLFNFLKK